MSRFGPSLGAVPVWLFSVGMPAALPKRVQPWAMQEEDQMAQKLSAFVDPRGHRLFSGVVRKAHLSPAERPSSVSWGAATAISVSGRRSIPGRPL